MLHKRRNKMKKLFITLLLLLAATQKELTELKNPIIEVPKNWRYGALKR